MLLHSVSSFSCNTVDGLEGKLAKSGSRSITTPEPTAYIKPVEDVIIKKTLSVVARPL